MQTTIAHKKRGGFYPKACPKCSGDMSKGKDFYSEFISCYQCGFEMAEPKAAVKPFGNNRNIDDRRRYVRAVRLTALCL